MPATRTCSRRAPIQSQPHASHSLCRPAQSVWRPINSRTMTAQGISSWGRGTLLTLLWGSLFARALGLQLGPRPGANVTRPTTSRPLVITTSACARAACGEAFKSFTTTSTEWYAFGDSINSFNVTYGGQTYNVTASQRSGSTCETLHVPSGTVDTTYGQACVVGEPSTTTSTSTTSNLGVCESAMNTQLNLVPKPTVYVKVVTDQGTVITNGSLS